LAGLRPVRIQRAGAPRRSKRAPPRRLAAAEQREEERRFRDFAEAASDWFWEMGPDLRVTYVSDRIFDIVGVRPEALVGRSRWEFAVHDGSADWAAHRATMEAREHFRNFSYPLTSASGEVKIVRISGKPVFDEEGRFLGYRGAGQDVTAQSAAERRAKDAEARLARALESVGEGIALWDHDDRLVFANSWYRRQSGKAASILTPGTSYEDYLVESIRCGEIPEAIGREAEWLRARIEKHREPGPPIELRRGALWLKVSEQRLPDGGTILTATDMSEQKAREEAYRGAKEEAERANRAKSEFLALMSHELRTPLNAILGFSELIRDGGLGPDALERYREYAADIHVSGSHLLRIINDLLDLAKIDAGKFELAEDWLNLADEAAGVARMLEGQAKAARLRLKLAPSEPAPELYADPRAIKQILVNLVSNALKFTPPGGRVRIASRLLEDGRLELSVSDTGIGMSEAEIPRALEPFSQVDGVLARRHEGTGLGLPIVRALASLHGAAFDIRSAPGTGTSIAVRFGPERLRRLRHHPDGDAGQEGDDRLNRLAVEHSVGVLGDVAEVRRQKDVAETS
jgi:two-component system cell cycle sensor histidine kinase PleC